MIIYIYNDGIEGFFSCVFKAYVNQTLNCGIVNSKNYTPNLIDDFEIVDTDYTNTERIKKSIIKFTNTKTYLQIQIAFLSGNKNKDTIIFNYLKQLFKYKQNTQHMLNNKHIIAYNTILKQVLHERHSFTGFLRFREIEKDLLFSTYSPDNNITSLLLPHFVKRLNFCNFIIYDEKRNIVGVYNKENKTYFVKKLEKPVKNISFSSKNLLFEQLWKEYFNNLSIKERKNKKCQNNNLSVRYRKNMTEFSTKTE